MFFLFPLGDTLGASQLFPRLRAGYWIEVSVSGVSFSEQTKVNGWYRVNDAGKVSLVGVGEFDVAGPFLGALEEKIAECYKMSGIYGVAKVSIFSGTRKQLGPALVAVSGCIDNERMIEVFRGSNLGQILSKLSISKAARMPLELVLWRDNKGYLLRPTLESWPYGERVYGRDHVVVGGWPMEGE